MTVIKMSEGQGRHGDRDKGVGGEQEGDTRCAICVHVCVFVMWRMRLIKKSPDKAMGKKVRCKRGERENIRMWTEGCEVVRQARPITTNVIL